jgi:transmembrane sensor
MEKEEFIRIAEKVVKGTATVEELGQYNIYYNQYQIAYPGWESIDLKEREDIREAIFQHIDSQLQPRSRINRTRLWPTLTAVAAVLIVVGFGLYMYMAKNNSLIGTGVINRTANDVGPGGRKAFLTLSNGNKISLSEVKTGELTRQYGTQITKTADGQLIYKVTSQSGNAGGNNFNTIETPKGGEFQVMLPDGTHVWLNAASSIRYPVKFSGKQRMVDVTGEAYFEVAHNAKIPFIVRTEKQQIEVLGTHFNVMAYADEADVKTTLIEGSVKITTKKNTLVLHPGQQARVQSDFADLNRDADIDAAVIWRKGKIQFAQADIRQIMRMLSRWYNVDVVYQGAEITNSFGGSVSRAKNISAILNLLESTGDVHFKIEGRRVTVMP